MLEDGYSVFGEDRSPEEYSKLEFLSDNIFEFITLDSEIAEYFAFRAIQVCQAINDRTTFQFIEDSDNYRWYLAMCNMPFFADKISWGCSIRGAFWKQPLDPESGKFVSIKPSLCGLFDGQEQLLDMEFTLEEWKNFIKALIEFTAKSPPIVVRA